MREERKLNKAIKQDGVDTQAEILDELKRRYPQYVAQSDNKRVATRKNRTAFVLAAFAAVAVCAAIIVPCAVLLPNSNNGDSHGGSGIYRYCGVDEYSKEGVEYTIAEYRENNNRNFLYFDWYERGEDRNTNCYVSNSDNEVLCLEENIYLPQSDELIFFFITKENVYLSEFDYTFELCTCEQVVENHAIKWSIIGGEAYCIFEESGYRYFIRIDPGKDENRLFELVAELLETN